MKPTQLITLLWVMKTRKLENSKTNEHLFSSFHHYSKILFIALHIIPACWFAVIKDWFGFTHFIFLTVSWPCSFKKNKYPIYFMCLHSLIIACDWSHVTVWCSYRFLEPLYIAIIYIHNIPFVNIWAGIYSFIHYLLGSFLASDYLGICSCVYWYSTWDAKIDHLCRLEPRRNNSSFCRWNLLLCYMLLSSKLTTNTNLSSLTVKSKWTVCVR